MADQPTSSVTAQVSMASLIADNQNDPVVREAGSDTVPSEPEFLADAAFAFNESPGEGDVLDLADVLLGSPGSHNIEDYVLAIDNGTSSTLLIDTSGTGNFANPDLVFQIDGVNWDSSQAGLLADLVSDSVIIVA